MFDDSLKQKPFPLIGLVKRMELPEISSDVTKSSRIFLGQSMTPNLWKLHFESYHQTFLKTPFFSLMNFAVIPGEKR